MIERPQFKAHFHVETIEGEGVFLISEMGHAMIRGPLFGYLAPLLDGTRTTDDIVDELEPLASPAEIYYALMLLEQAGYLTESQAGLSTQDAALWCIQGVDPRAAARRLADTSVSVIAFGDVEVEQFVKSLSGVGVRLETASRLEVVLADDYLRIGLQSYNLSALQSGKPWLLIKSVGHLLYIGPLFIPGQTGCWECLAQRLRLNRAVEVFVQRKQGRAEPFPVNRASTPATRQIAYSIAATEIMKGVAGGRFTPLEGKILSLDVLSWKTQTHRLLRQPFCPACGDPSRAVEQLNQPVVLESRKKVYLSDGGHRSVAPEETLRKYEHHVSPLTGAVSHLARNSSNEAILHSYVAGDNHAINHEDFNSLRWSLRNKSAGKGTSDLQARVSGLCEALERYSGVYQGYEDQCRATLKDLAEAGIHPNDCMQFSDRQYRERDLWNARKSQFNYVPVPFDEEAEMDWTPVWSLTRQSFRYLPTAFCYYGYQVPEERYCIACSNGNAAGNTLEEAILQGFLELVERDSVALWWYNRVRRPGVDLDSFGEPYLVELQAFLEKHRRELSVLDLTSDLRIPVFAAISRRNNHDEEQIMMGFGAHLDPKVALLRAVTEMNQMLAWVLQNNNSLDLIDDSETLTWLKTATLERHPYLSPDNKARLRRAADFPNGGADDLREDVLACQRAVEKLGMEMLILNQTRPDIELPVVKVIVPGLRHFSARFAPGRLYEVPVKLGWLPETLTEDQLNPVPMFL